MIGYVRNRQGLTLVELVITLVIVALLATLMVPGLGRWLSHYRIKGVARDIASCFRLAQMKAVQTNQTCTVRFDARAGFPPTVTVIDGGGVSIRAIDLSEHKAQFDTTSGGGDGFDFIDQPADKVIDITYNTRGIPSDEQSNPLTPPGVQDGQRVFLVNNRGEGYWVEVSPVGNVRYDRV